MGARPMARLIQEKLKKELAEDILFGELADGGDVEVSAGNNGIELKIRRRRAGNGKPKARQLDESEAPPA